MLRDLTGKRYGRYIVIGPSERGSKYVLCLCDCGIQKSVRRQNLFCGGTVSCGCHRNSLLRRHGKSRHNLTYGSWLKMKARCTNPNHIAYHRYGGRGITFPERWHDFENFLADLGERPSKQHSLDRIDNMRGYSRENCRWATYHEQSRNRSVNRMLTYNGVTMCCADWAQKLGLTRAGLLTRLRRGWSVEEAIIGTRPRKALP